MIECLLCGGKRPDDRARCPHCRGRALNEREKGKMRDQSAANFEMVGKYDPVLRRIVPLDADDWRDLKGNDDK